MTHPVRLARLGSRPLAVVRRRARPQELSRVVPEACGIVWNVIRTQQIKGAGRHVAVYSGLRDQPRGRRRAGNSVRGLVSSTPSGLVATTTHYGPYQLLRQAHAAIRLWCEDHGCVLTGPSWEIYGHWQDDWNSDPTKISTEVFYLLVDDGRSAGAPDSMAGARR